MASDDRPHSKWYLHHLDTHIKASLKATLGNYPHPSLQVPPSDIPPSNAVWTSSEKDAFFAALSRHSRYRPDLIASEVGKSEIEVVWYLEFLEKEKVNMVNKEKRESRMKELKGSSKWREGLAPAAREVSDKWVEKEEELASGLHEMLEEMAQEHELGLSRKRKREAKRSIIQAAVIPPDTKSGDKTKFIDNLPEMQKLDQQWEAEDWLAVMDPEKLFELDDCIQQAWLAESQEELVRNAEPGGAEDAPSPSAPSTVSKTAIKVARDLRTMSLISSIPKKKRTPEQRRLFTAAKNRQRAREQYRAKKLLVEGMTEEDIRKAGGADAVFAQKEGQELPIDVGRGARQRPEIRGVHDHVNEAGLEIFAFANMARFLNSHEVPSDTSNISLPVLQDLREELVGHLKLLLYDVITVAEKERLQDQSLDDVRLEIASNHVQQALALRGDIPPSFIVDPALSKIQPVKTGQTTSTAIISTDSAPDTDIDMSGNATEGTVSEASEESLEGYPENVLPPTALSWSLLPHLRLISETRSNGHESSAATDSDEDEDEILYEEDVMLDQALEEVDLDHDKLYEKELWGVNQEEEDKDDELDDHADVWAEDPTERSKHEQGKSRRLSSILN
ncbi:hypothetical protein I350_04240 [Cryptococcus amylolentus CBS 6273]|uniref:Uncharacterized protein n=1 Tax=Cryptococcus amylolentus CBS 6273 TaxID=1296118 RepID=A0A1E3K191_9TREE|nr:hypothetical protein I350_04240 [Cryptococcus amylolentus CBS 6273]